MAKLVLQHGRKVIDLLIYILLVGVSYVLIKGIYDIFMLGILDYHYTKHPVTVSDNPAVLVLVVKNHADDEITFGVNYTIEVFDWDDESKKYVTNPNDVLIFCSFEEAVFCWLFSIRMPFFGLFFASSQKFWHVREHEGGPVKDE